jgi:ParB-like chromosome segregation protein Spo0J
MEKLNIAAIKPNEENPRFITDAKFKKLVKSIKDFPEMLEARPLVIDEDNIVLGGNMRLKALKAAGVFEIPVKRVIGWTEQQKKEFIIKDNIGYGEWDWDILANEWELDILEDWGLDINALEQKIDDMQEGESLDIPKSLQVLPKKEYIIIMAEEDSIEWEELKTIFSCGLVRQGGCKYGSSSDKATTGLERVFDLKTFKERVLNGLRDSNTK